MPSEVFLLPYRPALDANAIPIVGAQLEFYASQLGEPDSPGTTTPQAVYANEALTVSLGAVVTANSAGVWPTIYLDKTKIYRVILRSPDGEVLREADPYVASVVDNLAPEIALNAAKAAASAGLSEAFAAALSFLTAGYIQDGSSLPPVGVGNGEGYFFTINQHLFGALNNNGVPDIKFEIATKASIDDALLTVPAIAREVNPELPISTFMQGRENDADHTARFNEAIDKLNVITDRRGGTIRLDRASYNVSSVQAIQSAGTWIKGVGASQPLANNDFQIDLAKQFGSVIEMLPGAGDAFTWGNQDGGGGYLFQGGGLSDLTIFGAEGRTGYAANVMRARGWTARDVNIWRPWNGIRVYGGLGVYLNNIYIDQLRGEFGLAAIGDEINKGDVLDLDHVWIGAQDAATNSRGIGLLIRGYYHTVTCNVLRVVNPSYGVYADTQLAADHMRPFVLRFQGLEIDFAQNECVKLVNYRDAEFIGGYYHGLGQATVFSAEIDGRFGGNNNDELRIIGGKFSGAGGIGCLNLSGSSSTVTGASFHAPVTADNNCIVVGPLSEKTKITGCSIGEVGNATKNAPLTGIRVFAGARKTDIDTNSFYNCDTPVVNSADPAETTSGTNHVWGA